METPNAEELAKKCDELTKEVRDLRIELKISYLERTVLQLKMENNALIGQNKALKEQLENPPLR